MEKSPVNFDPNAIAIQYYFGDLQYWKLPGICIDALAAADNCVHHRPKPVHHVKGNVIDSQNHLM
jgi:hypothetical protein